MLVTPDDLFGPVQLAGSEAIIYTAPSNSIVVVTRVVFTNVSATTRLVTVHLGRGGAAASEGNKILKAWPVSVNEDFVARALAGLVLQPTDVLRAFADAGASVNAVGSGYLTQ